MRIIATIYQVIKHPCLALPEAYKASAVLVVAACLALLLALVFPVRTAVAENKNPTAILQNFKVFPPVITITPVAPQPMQKIGGGHAITIREEINQVFVDLGGGIAVQVYRNGGIGCTVDGVPYTSAQQAIPRLIGLAKHTEKPGYVPGKTPVNLFQNELPTQTLASEFFLDKTIVSGNAVKLLFRSKDNPAAILHYYITPSVYRLENGEWRGFGISYQIEAPGAALSNLLAPTVWRLGTPDIEFKAWGHTPYGKPRGFHDVRLTSGIFKSEKLDFHNVHFDSQAFTLVAGDGVSHLSFMEPGMVANCLLKSARGGYSVTYSYELGLTSMTMTPVTHHLFFKRRVTAQDYPGIAWSLNAHLRALAGLPPLSPEPIAAVSRDNQINTVTDWRKYADKVIPTSKRLGFRRIFAGLIPARKPQLIFEFPNKDKIFADLKFFNDRAHKEGIATILWAPVCTAQNDAEVVRYHPDWALIQADGSAAHYHMLENLLILYPDKEYTSWLLAQLTELRQRTGLDGLWLDSVGLAARLVTFSGRQNGSPLRSVQELITGLTADGYILYAEGLTPFAISSFWVRKEYYESYAGFEYGLTGCSPLTNRPDSNFVDYFKAASFKSFPLFDIQPMIEGKPVYPSQDVIASQIAMTNKAVCRAIDVLGHGTTPRAFSGGAFWISDKGMAVFAHQAIGRLELRVDASSKVEVFFCRPGLNSPNVLASPDGPVVEMLPAETMLLVTFPDKG